jgi:hypothetical protein
VFGGRVDIAEGSVDDDDPLVAGILDIDVVDTDAGPGDDFQLPAVIEQRRVDPSAAAGNDCFVTADQLVQNAAVDLDHGAQRQQLLEVDVEPADDDGVTGRPGRQAKDFVEHRGDAATMSVPRRPLGLRAEPDPRHQGGIGIAVVADAKAPAGGVTGDEAQGIADQGGGVEGGPARLAGQLGDLDQTGELFAPFRSDAHIRTSNQSPRHQDTKRTKLEKLKVFLGVLGVLVMEKTIRMVQPCFRSNSRMNPARASAPASGIGL